MKLPRLSRSHFGLAVAGLAAAAVFAAACGGSGSASTATSTPSGAASASASGTPRRGFRGTPPAAIQTAIAEGTPASALFGNRTPRADIQTAIAEGTPRSALGFGGGFGGGRQALTAAATILGIDETQLRSELQAPGATLAGVAAAHGQDRTTFKQALINATQQRLNDAVKAGTITQATADQVMSQFQSTLDQLLDNPGGALPSPAPTP